MLTADLRLMIDDIISQDVRTEMLAAITGINSDLNTTFRAINAVSSKFGFVDVRRRAQ